MQGEGMVKLLDEMSPETGEDASQRPPLLLKSDSLHGVKVMFGGSLCAFIEIMVCLAVVGKVCVKWR